MFRVLDSRAVLTIVLLCLELLQKAETRRSGRMPRSAVLGHAETLLTTMRQSVTTERRAAHLLQPGVATGAKLHAVRRDHEQRKDSPDRQKARGWTVGLARADAAVRR